MQKMRWFVPRAVLLTLITLRHSPLLLSQNLRVLSADPGAKYCLMFGVKYIFMQGV